MAQTPFKRLESALHELAEELTKGTYGKGREVDIESLRGTLFEALVEYEVDSLVNAYPDDED